MTDKNAVIQSKREKNGRGSISGTETWQEDLRYGKVSGEIGMGKEHW